MDENEKKSKKGSKKILAVLLLLLIIGAVVLWFKRFKVVIKYNNGLSDTVLVLRFYSLINVDDINHHLGKDGYILDNFYETYIISKDEIDKVKVNNELGNTICKEGFEFYINDYKCISKTAFDFENTRITKDTIIEAVWMKEGNNYTE